MESEFKITIFGLKMIVKRGPYTCVWEVLMIHFPKIGVWSTWRTSGMPNGEKFTHKEAFNNYLDKNRGRGDTLDFLVVEPGKIGKINKRRAWKIWQ